MKSRNLLIIALSACIALSVLTVWYRQSRDAAEPSPPMQGSSTLGKMSADKIPGQVWTGLDTSRPTEVVEPRTELEDRARARNLAGTTLPELFANADQTIRDARRTLADKQCLKKRFVLSKLPDGCAAGALYEAALLVEYCGQNHGPVGPFEPERLDLLGVTNLAERRKAEAEMALQAREDRYIQEQCPGLSQALLSLPTLTDRTDESSDKLSMLWPNVPYMRLHAALLGDERAMRWAVQDWRYADEGYLSQRTLDSIVRHVESYDPAEGHRLRYQFERYREPDTYLWVERPDAPRDEERLVEAAAHLIAWQRLSGSMYDRPADLRWQDMKERHFLERLDENTRSLAEHRANQLLSQSQ